MSKRGMEGTIPPLHRQNCQNDRSAVLPAERSERPFCRSAVITAVITATVPFRSVPKNLGTVAALVHIPKL